MTSLSTSNTKSSTTKYYNNLDNANEKIKQLEIENIKLKKLLTKYETNNNNSSKKIDDEQPLSTEQELRLTKALLLLQNVDVNVQLNDTNAFNIGLFVEFDHIGYNDVLCYFGEHYLIIVCNVKNIVT